MRYKNLSVFTKTFYGVEIKSGEVKDIPGNVNDPEVIRWFGSDIAPSESEAKVEEKTEAPAADKTDSTESAPKSRKRSVKEA